jgi:hypothetical protein
MAEDEMSAINKERDELLDALQEAHRALDLLLAQVATLENKFMPTQSPAWPAVLKAHRLLTRYGRFQ